MIEPSSSIFWQMALRSGLITAAQLQQCWDAIPPEKRTAELGDRRLASRAVEAGHLTLWQAHQLLSGRGAGLRIDKYVLLDVIGKGGMGRVYLALDGRLRRRVALKLLPPGRLSDPGAVARFRREARLGAQLQHENLVRIYDEGEIRGHYYLVMEYIEGPSVGRLLNEYGPIPASTAARLARQVALALEHARIKGMIHRDVNPGNILVTREGTAKLADLGLAIELGDDDAMTQDGALLGNYDYISPEQARHSRGVDTRSDIYSLGCTLYHMVVGRAPFPFPSLPEKIGAHLAEEPPSPSTLVPGIPEGLVEVVARMMRKSPDDRYPDPLAVAKALEPFIEGLTDPVAPPRSGGGGLDSAGPPAPPARGFGGVAGGDGQRSPRPSRRSTGSIGSTSLSGFDTPAPPPPSIPQSTLEEFDPGALEFDDPRVGSAPPGFQGQAPPPRSAVTEVFAALRVRPPKRRPRVATLLGLVLGLATSLALLAGLRGGLEGLWNLGPGSTGSQLVVAVLGPDGRETIVGDLGEALRSQARDDLRIVLRGRGPGPGPVRLEALETLAVTSGSVTLRADPGTGRALTVVPPASGPLLRVGPRATLRLEGLAIRVEYPTPGIRAHPLIESAGTLILRQCAFWADDRAIASGAVDSDGPRFSATGCWFGGFRQCLDFGAFAGAEISLDQCMLIRSPGSDPAGDWAIRVRREPSRARDQGRKLSLRRCTISDACLLRADDFTPSGPLTVSIAGTVVQAGALLGWKSEAALDGDSLKWTGRHNLYDLSRPSWAIHLAGAPSPQDGPIDPNALGRLMDEGGSRERPAAYPDSASRPADSPGPESFPPRVFGEEEAIGADPRRVGPNGRGPG